MTQFISEIVLDKINPFIIIPKEVLEAFKVTKGNVKVIAKIDGHAFKATLVPYCGKYRLFINGVMRNTIKKGVGQAITVDVCIDTEPRTLDIPKVLLDVLNLKGEAKSKFEALSKSRQKEICAYIESLKKEESKVKNVEKVIRYLLK